MSESQVKELLGSAVASPAPDRLDVDAMVRGGVRRRRRRMLGTLAAVAAVLVVVGAVVVTARPSADVPPAGNALPLPTSTWQEGGDGMTALLVTTLRLGADGCIEAEDGAPIIWPAGYTAERVDGTAVVKDGGGEVVAQAGQEVSLGGGYGANPGGPCLDGQGDPYYVNDSPPFTTAPPAQTIAVPDLTGLPVPQAVAMLKELGLKPGELAAITSTGDQVNAVLVQEPAAGSTVAVGSSISLRIGTGPGAAEGLRGFRFADAPLPCEDAIVRAARLDPPGVEPIRGNASRITVCPGQAQGTVEPKVIGPSEVLVAIEALSTPDEVLAEPIPCPTPPAKPLLLVETDQGIWLAHIPVTGCGAVQPKVADLLGLSQ